MRIDYDKCEIRSKLLTFVFSKMFLFCQLMLDTFNVPPSNSKIIFETFVTIFTVVFLSHRSKINKNCLKIAL